MDLRLISAFCFKYTEPLAASLTRPESVFYFLGLCIRSDRCFKNNWTGASYLFECGLLTSPSKRSFHLQTAFSERIVCFSFISDALCERQFIIKVR